MHPGGSQSENGEPYSYLCMDSEWNTVQRGGPWGGMELGSLTHIHRDFCENALTEILLRYLPASFKNKMIYETKIMML